MSIQTMSDSILLQRIAKQCEGKPRRPLHNANPTQTFDWSLPGFGAGARVATAFGHVPVELLRLRDEIRTRDGRILRIRHIDKVQLDRKFLLTHPSAQPISLAKGCLGVDVPNATTLVSCNQKLMSSQNYGQQTCKKAKSYLVQANINVSRHGNFDYYVFHCGEPCTASVNGLWVELNPADFQSFEDD